MVGVSRVRSTGGVREKRGSRHGAGCERGFLVYPGVRRAGAQEEGGGRAAGSGGFSRVTGAPPAVGWLVGSRGEEVGGGFGGLPRGKRKEWGWDV